MLCLVAKQNSESVVSLHKEDASTLPIHYIPLLICYQFPSRIQTLHLRGFSTAETDAVKAAIKELRTSLDILMCVM